MHSSEPRKIRGLADLMRGYRPTLRYRLTPVLTRRSFEYGIPYSFLVLSELPA